MMEFYELTSVQALIRALMATIPALGFAMLFNVPRQSLKWVACAGFIAYLCRSIGLELGLSIELASLLAAITLGFVTVRWSRRLLIPRPVLTVPAIIPMFPGSFAFNAMIAIVEISRDGYSHELFDLAALNGLKMLFILGALCFGIALPSVLVFREKPIV